MGRVRTGDGSAIPNDMLVERVCNNRVRQQIYAAPNGEFSMQLGSKANTYVDASADANAPYEYNSKVSMNGIPKSELTTCELRTSAAGFRPSVFSLMELTPSGGTVDVGAIVVERMGKEKGATLSARPYQAPDDARKAYEKGVAAAKKGKYGEARQFLEKAVERYPRYTSAWYELGGVLLKANDQDAAQNAYLKATTIDSKFLPPYLKLATMAFDRRDWKEVLHLTQHILDLDPLNRTAVTEYIVDFDPESCAEAYFYNAVANYEVGRMGEAEKSALKAEHVDLLTRFPQLHLLLAEIFARRSNYAGAMDELRTYLELVPNANDTDRVREQLAAYQKANASAAVNEKTNHN
jgi:thioredoxin-like negative regulator of GroEL